VDRDELLADLAVGLAFGALIIAGAVAVAEIIRWRLER
jgi:hypothetical protein